jgi:Xaa-Pro dipeptidase
MNDPRLSIVYSVLERENLDAVAFVPGPNFRKLFNQDFHLMERPLVVIVPRVGSPVAIVPNLEMASFAKLSFPGEVIDWRDEAGFCDAFEAAALALPQLEHARIGLEAQRMRAFEMMELSAVFPDAELTDAHQAISTVRLHKEANEVDLLRHAIKISEAALEDVLQTVAIGQTEKEIEAELLRALFSHGADGLSFDPIVAAGDNSAQPHAHARSDYKIKAGDSLLIDFGASWQGYNADITRTFFVGHVSENDRAFYETVLAANLVGLAATIPNATAHDVDDAVQVRLENSQFAAFKRHKTGHGLGLDVHEAPQIMRGNDAVLEPGMVFTVEPGLYREGECGVRIEDDVLVTETGYDCLTSFSKDLRIVG